MIDDDNQKSIRSVQMTPINNHIHPQGNISSTNVALFHNPVGDSLSGKQKQRRVLCTSTPFPFFTREHFCLILTSKYDVFALCCRRPLPQKLLMPHNDILMKGGYN